MFNRCVQQLPAEPDRDRENDVALPKRFAVGVPHHAANLDVRKSMRRAAVRI